MWRDTKRIQLALKLAPSGTPENFPISSITDFAGNLPAAEAQFMAVSQVPITAKIFGTPITAPIWKSKPSYGIVATQDRMINPNLERSMYMRAKAKITESKGGHVVFISQPRAVADVIEQAARGGQ